jgi:hypothetical protein
VEEEEARSLDGGDRRSVDLDPVLRAYIEGRRGEGRAVDADPARRYQRLGLAARGNAGPRQPLGDALAPTLPLCGRGGAPLGPLAVVPMAIAFPGG